LLIKRQHWVGVGPVDDQPLRYEVYASQRHAHKNNELSLGGLIAHLPVSLITSAKKGQHWDFYRSAKGAKCKTLSFSSGIGPYDSQLYW
jgi:hypothetical protein